MQDSLKEKTISGMIWNGIQQFGSMLLSFIANLILARLLTPDDFGCIGMIMVFIAVANIFVDGGFGAALIQKRNPTQEDYSTIFYWNLVLSIFLFFVLYLLAPYIAGFYKISFLSSILRVLGCVLIINAFSVIQTNILIKQLNFKRLAQINIVASIVGIILGVSCAFVGLGIWSLVVQILTISFVRAVLFWVINRWYPCMVFSRKSFIELLGFGGLMLLSNVAETISNNIQSLIIGRFFSAKDLGFYTQAKKLEEVPVNGLAQVVDQVTFPVFSSIRKDSDDLKQNVKKTMKAITFFNFPLMVVLIVIAYPLFNILYTEKWNAAVPYFQILCIEAMFFTLNTTNTNIFKSIGRSDVYFYVQLIKRIVGIVIILIGLKFGVWGIMWSLVLNSYLYFFINSIVTGWVIHYGLIEQIKDVVLNYLLAILVGLVTYYLTRIIDVCDVFLLMMQVGIYVLLYLGLAYCLKLEGGKIYYAIIKNKIINFSNKNI